MLMDQAEDGIVMISFGTLSNISQILPDINNNLINVLKKFPKVCIWLLLIIRSFFFTFNFI